MGYLNTRKENGYLVTVTQHTLNKVKQTSADRPGKDLTSSQRCLIFVTDT